MLSGLSLTVVLAFACGEPPTAPSHGSVQVSVRTDGGDPDTDGYTLVINDERRPLGAVYATAGPIRLAAGTHTVSITDVAPNCLVSGQHPRSVTVGGGQEVQLEFVIDCATTGLEIIISATGDNVPLEFVAYVGDETARRIPASTPLVVSRLQAGTRLLRFALAEHCAIVGGADRTTTAVTVVNRVVTRVTVELACRLVIRPEKIAFVRVVREGNLSHNWIAVANPDGSGTLLLRLGNSPAWSHDGKQLALSTTVCDEYGYGCTGGLVIVDPETREATTPSYGRSGMDPAWAPTGDAIAFTICCGGASGTTSAQMYIVALGGTSSNAFPMPGLLYARGPSWSPDGQKIVFECVPSPGKYDLCVVQRNGTGLVRLTNTDGWEEHPRWSSDGSTIVFHTYAAGDWGIAVMPAAGGTITHLAAGWSPAWSPDSRTIVFARSDGLFTMNADGSNITRLTTGIDGAPAWRPLMK